MGMAAAALERSMTVSRGIPDEYIDCHHAIRPSQ